MIKHYWTTYQSNQWESYRHPRQIRSQFNIPINRHKKLKTFRSSSTVSVIGGPGVIRFHYTYKPTNKITIRGGDNYNRCVRSGFKINTECLWL